LKVVTIACKHVIDTEELSALNESLVSVLLSIDSRIQNLEGVLFLSLIISHELTTVGVLKQTHIDVQARLGNFAFGIVGSYLFYTYPLFFIYYAVPAFIWRHQARTHPELLRHLGRRRRGQRRWQGAAYFGYHKGTSLPYPSHHPKIWNPGRLPLN
jgi:hypothetical protein